MSAVRRIAPALAALLVIALTVSLGNWQVRRAHEKQALAERQQQLRGQPPAWFDDGATAAARPDLNRRLRVRGQFQPDKAILIDNRTHNGVAGFHLLMPLRLADSDRLVLVLRGWLPSNPAHRNAWPPITTPSGIVELDGDPQADLPQPMQLGRDPVPGAGDRIWQYFSLAKYQHWAGRGVEAFIIRQTSNLDDGLIRDWPQPGSDVDRHYGYAFQWYGMALATAVLWIWYGWRRRPRVSDHR